jgi:hypothetical protein
MNPVTENGDAGRVARACATVAGVAGIEDEIARLERRMEELHPYVEEYEQVKRMLEAAKGELRREGPTLRGIRVPLPERMVMVEEAIEVRGPRRLKDLAADLEVSVPRMVEIVKAMEAEGRLRRARGLFHLPGGGTTQPHSSEE